MSIITKSEPTAAVSGRLMAFIFASVFQSSFAQMDMGDHEDSMNTTDSGAVNASSSPVKYSIRDTNMEVRMSWQPETINTNDTTRFTFRFLDTETHRPFQNVSFSVHMTLDAKSIGHAHESIAQNGTATIEQKFDSVGSLVIIVESIKAGDESVTGFAQFGLTVVPEFPIGVVLVASTVVGGILVATRVMRITHSA